MYIDKIRRTNFCYEILYNNSLRTKVDEYRIFKYHTMMLKIKQNTNKINKRHL